MKKFLEYLNEKNEKYKDLIITDVEYDLDVNTLRIKAQYTCDFFSDELREELENNIRDFLNRRLKVEVKLKKYLIDQDVIIGYIINYIEINFPSLASQEVYKNIVIESFDRGLYKITFNLEKDNYDYLLITNFIEDIVDYLKVISKEDYDISLNLIETENYDTNILKQRQAILASDFVKPIDYEPIEVSNIHNLVGEIDVDFVYPIATIDDQDKAVIVGSISYLKVNEYESRFKNKDGTSKIAKRVNFSLNDGSDKINCVYFPSSADEAKIEELQNDEKVIIVGEVKSDEERGRSCKIKSIALCSFEPFKLIEPEVEIKKVNENYEHVFPRQFLTNKQSGLFVEEEKIDEFLLNNEVVVFDLETTGLNVNDCEIIEIGAVKLVKGKIVEIFETLIKPKNPIPEEATAVNNITNEMVENELSVEFIFPDFYKFIQGAVLVAYNINYDYSVIKAYGDKNGYIIDNKQLDALKLARKALPSRKSYKLGKVVKALGINLDNAHRALFDTIATADVLKKTISMLSAEDRAELLNIFN